MKTPETFSLSRSLNRQFELGLRWLDADDEAVPVPKSGAPAHGVESFLHQAESLPPQRRLRWARLWPALAGVNGVLAFSGLMVWPSGSGVHLLVFLLAFWLVPVGLWVWTLLASVGLKRAPWWRGLVTPHVDGVVAVWCGRQALLAQLGFVSAGLLWMWLMLATRQVIFYWSTSIEAVSRRVDDLFRVLSLGVIDAPEPLVVGSAQAGAITGWEQGLLSHSYYWAAWLSQVVVLWVAVPLVLGLGLCHWVLRRRIRRWPRWNRALALRCESALEPVVSFRALQPEQPVTEPLTHRFPVVTAVPTEPGFVWQYGRERRPTGSVLLGSEQYRDDLALIDVWAGRLRFWYIPGHTVPTGDLADLIARHVERGGEPRLCVMVAAEEPVDRLEALKHSWSAFLDRNRLAVPLELVRESEAAHDGTR